MTNFAAGGPRRAGAWCAALLFAACGGDATSPEFSTPDEDPAVTYGTLAITMHTTGDAAGDLDPDGYHVVVARSSAVVERTRIGPNANLSLDVPIGRAEIRFGDVAENCAVVGGDARSVDVPRGANVPLQVEIACRHWPEQSGGVDDLVGEWIVVRLEEASVSDFSIGVSQWYTDDIPVRLRIVRTGDARVSWEWREFRRTMGDVIITGSASMLEGAMLRSVVVQSWGWLEELREWGILDMAMQGDLLVERRGDQLVIHRAQPGYYLREGLSWTRVTLARDE